MKDMEKKLKKIQDKIDDIHNGGGHLVQYDGEFIIVSEATYDDIENDYSFWNIDDIYLLYAEGEIETIKEIENFLKEYYEDF